MQLLISLMDSTALKNQSSKTMFSLYFLLQILWEDDNENEKFVILNSVSLLHVKITSCECISFF